MIEEHAPWQQCVKGGKFRKSRPLWWTLVLRQLPYWVSAGLWLWCLRRRRLAVAA